MRQSGLGGGVGGRSERYPRSEDSGESGRELPRLAGEDVFVRRCRVSPSRDLRAPRRPGLAVPRRPRKGPANRLNSKLRVRTVHRSMLSILAAAQWVSGCKPALRSQPSRKRISSPKSRIPVRCSRRIGDHVRAGQVLAVIDIPEMEQELAEDQASLLPSRVRWRPRATRWTTRSEHNASGRDVEASRSAVQPGLDLRPSARSGACHRGDRHGRFRRCGSEQRPGRTKSTSPPRPLRGSRR